jgi:hypothetical protein
VKNSKTNEMPVMDFQKELDIRKLGQLLRDSFSSEYVFSLLYQVRLRVQPEQREPLTVAQQRERLTLVTQKGDES